VDAAGNAYVTGCSYGDIWLRKYDTDGNTLWTETYDSPGHYNDYGRGVAVDAAGNVYVTGYEYRYDLGQNANIWLRKYDTGGNTLWTETYNSPAHDGDDRGYGVAVDAAGNVYVAGHSSGDIWLRKYDTNGNTLWTETREHLVGWGDACISIALDAADNVYVTGAEHGGPNTNIILLKYEQVPEPSTLLLLAPALLGFAGVVLKRRR
jgi:sugar lactone lactonase YvrE